MLRVEGVRVTHNAHLVVTDIAPAAGSTLSTGETIRIQFNKLMNTDEANLAAIQILDDQGVAFDSSLYTLTGTNTLSGAYVDVVFSDSFDMTLNNSGNIQIVVPTSVLDLAGDTLRETFVADFALVQGPRSANYLRWSPA